MGVRNLGKDVEYHIENREDAELTEDIDSD